MNTALKVILQSWSKIDLMSSAGTRWCHQIPPSGLEKCCRRGREKSLRATEDERYFRNQGLLDAAELARVGIQRLWQHAQDLPGLHKLGS